ncbi:hypothetical protein ACQJOI_000081 [Pseudomonas aeruginosa]
MSKEKWNLDLCGIATFAEMCSVSYDEAAQWAEDGTVPRIQMGCFRMINLARFRDDLERGKASRSWVGSTPTAFRQFSSL